MSDIKVYMKLFQEAFALSEGEIGDDTKYQNVHGWDSVGHMALMAAIEDSFGIELDIDDIIDFSSYKAGIKILEKYGVLLSESPQS